MSPIKLHNADFQNLKTFKTFFICLLVAFSFQNSYAQQDTINTSRYTGSIEQNNALNTEFWNPAYEIADINVDSASFFVDSADRNHAIAFVTVNKWLRGSGPNKISIPFAGYEGRYKRLDGSIKWIKCARTMYREKSVWGRNIVALSKVNGVYSYISFFRIPDYDRMPQSKYDRITFSKYYDYGNLVKDITWTSEEELIKYINSKLGKGKKSK